jgi:TonB-linked SusC/RagA family outer membrane protein
MRKITILLAFLLFAGLQGAFAQKAISGKVTSSEDGLALSGVTVVVKGTTVGTVTDMNGAFTLSVPADATTIVVSFIGMNPLEIPIGNQSVFTVSMTPAITALQDVVVTAFGISRQSKSLTYATQNVKTESLVEARNLNVVNGLSGRISGLSITQTSNGVGSESKVLLRGNRSIAGNSQPLYIIDGVPGGISDISPDDIESISVLKGANAAALYGSRANNGAIVVTTKNGKGKDGVSVNLGFTYQASSAIWLLHTQDTYGQGANGIYSEAATVSWGPKMDGSQVAHWSNDPNYSMYGKTYAYSPQPDNMTDFFRTGNNIATNLQVSVQNARSNTLFSYTNTMASGIVATNNLKGHNLNVRFGSKLTEKLTLDSKFTYNRQLYENTFYTGENFENPMRYLYILPRNIRTEDMVHYTFLNELQQNRQHYWKWNDNGSGNPYWSRNNIIHPYNSDGMNSMISLKYQIFKDLSILGRASLNTSFDRREYKLHNDTYTSAINGSYQKTNSSSYEWNDDVLVNYHKAISSNFTIDLNGGANHRQTEYEMVSGQGAVFQIENVFALSNTGNPRPSEAYSKKVVNSVYGFGEISFKNAIFLNITGRNDWSSTLPADSRSYFYPSIGLTAVLNDLITLPTLFTQVKLRGSYAEVGNDTDPYLLERQAIVGLGVISLSPVQPNSNLKPELTKSYEAGIDLRMIQDRLRFNFTWYQSNTYNQLFQTPVPSYSGISSIFQNGADVQNRGVELTIGGAIISKKDFSWNMDINWSKNNSEILEIAEGFDVLSFGADFMSEYKLVKGHEFGDQYAKGWLRNDKGEVIIQANGLPAITPGMTVKVANYNPDWLGGISNSFKYKSFYFNALIDIRQGGSFISFTEALVAGGGVLDYTTTGRDGSLLFGKNVYTNEKGVNEVKDADGNVTGYVENTTTCTAENFWNNIGGRNNPVGEPFVRSASNIRMREMILGYDVPKSIVSKTFFTSCRVSFVGRNLFFIQNKAIYTDSEQVRNTGISAEGQEAFALPTTRNYGVSLNFGF